jgi:hypothetical protein
MVYIIYLSSKLPTNSPIDLPIYLSVSFYLFIPKFIWFYLTVYVHRDELAYNVTHCTEYFAFISKCRYDRGV